MLEDLAAGLAAVRERLLAEQSLVRAVASGRGDIALRVPPVRWSEAEEALEAP